jgi:hypothetical protein
VIAMHIEFLVEELSMEMTLKAIVPLIIGPQHTFLPIHHFQHKDKLLKQLPKRMQAYANFIPADWRNYSRIMVIKVYSKPNSHKWLLIWMLKTTDQKVFKFFGMGLEKW